MIERDDVVEPAVHRLAANLIFDGDGLDPYWGMVSAFEPELSDELEPFDALDETYTLETSVYWQGKIADPDGDRDDGLYEYKLSVWDDSEVARRGADFTFRPGYPNAVHCESGDEISGIPDDCPESIRVQVEAVNLEPEEVLELLRALADAIALQEDYFREPHDWSSAYALETYARLERETATTELVGSGAVLEDLARFASSGGRGAWKWDHEEIKGHYEAVELDPDSWRDMIPRQQLAKRIKCYQPSNVRSDDSDDPLRDHKLECQYWSDYGDDSISWGEVGRAVDELRQTVLSVAAWADVPLEAEADVWTPDEYFDADSVDEPLEVLEQNPLPELEERQKLDARSDLIDPHATPAEYDVLEVATDGGSRHYEELAEKSGTSTSTVYRAVEQFDATLERDNGEIGFVDDVVRRTISDIVDRFESSKERAVDALRRVANQAAPLATSEDADPSALERWISAHAVDVRDRLDGLQLDFGGHYSRRELVEILRSGIQAAERSPILTKKFEQATLDYVDPDGQPHSNLRVVVRDGSTKKILGLEPLD